MNYDPNLTMSGNMAKQTVKLTFGIWEYRKEMLVEIKGNTNGLSVIRAAVSFAFDDLPFEKHGREEITYIVLIKGEDEMRCDDDEDKGEDWLENMLVGAEIISIVPLPDEDEQDIALVKARESEPTTPFKNE